MSTGHLCGRLGFKTQAGPTLRVSKQLRRMCCLYYDICKQLDTLVFSDKDEKLQVPSLASSWYWLVGDIKEPTHLLKKVGVIVPSVVVCPRFWNMGHLPNLLQKKRIVNCSMQSDQSPPQSVVRCIWSYSYINLHPISNKLLLILLLLLLLLLLWSK